VEASPRNTAAAITFAAFGADPEDILLVAPSDHLIKNEGLYKQSVEEAILLVKNGKIVTFGLQPKNPETGFGYIEYDGNNVISFREKPSKEMVESYLNSKRFLWNSSMFCFKAGVFLDELHKYEAKVFSASLEAFMNRKGIYLDGNALHADPFYQRRLCRHGAYGKN